MRTVAFRLSAWCLFLLATALTACNLKRVAVTPAPPSEQQMTRFRRTDQNKGAIVFGYIRVSDPQAGVYPLSAAILSLDEKISFANKSGEYSLTLPAGIHQFMTGQIGIHQSRIALKVKQGDSIRLDFNLRPDLRPLY
jgi:hypothetical protein